MVKISIKKDKKRKTKPRQKQKQKQKQTQNVVVDIGGNATRAKRRATGQALEKKAVNKPQQTPTPNIIVPQANPLNKQSDSTGEILRYIRESEQQKELIKKQEKNNELEKDKIKKASGVQTEDNAQIQFSTINSQNISSLTSGSVTPNPLSRPVDSRSLFD